MTRFSFSNVNWSIKGYRRRFSTYKSISPLINEEWKTRSSTSFTRSTHIFFLCLFLLSFVMSIFFPLSVLVIEKKKNCWRDACANNISRRRRERRRASSIALFHSLLICVQRAYTSLSRSYLSSSFLVIEYDGRNHFHFVVRFGLSLK